MAVTALYVSISKTISDGSKAEKERIRDQLIEQLNDRISLIQDKFILSHSRISNILNKLSREIAIAGDTLTAQPRINKALFKAFLRQDEERTKILRLSKELKIGHNIPPVLLDIFNMSMLEDQTIIKHSTVHSVSFNGQVLNIKVTLLKPSRNIHIMRADPFHYYGLDDSSICQFKYHGPELILYNETSKCFKQLYSEEVDEDITFSQGCYHRQAIEKKDLFLPENCRKLNSTSSFIPKVQIKHTGSQLRINCQGHNITLDNVVHNCPNHIIGIEENTKFQIDNIQTYITGKSSAKKQLVSYDIPEKQNLQLGTAGIEFNSITTKELQELNAKAKETSDKIVTNKIQSEEEGIVDSAGSLVDSLITISAKYVTFLIVIFLLTLYLKGRFLKRRSQATVATTAILCTFLLPVLCNTSLHTIQVKYSAEEATNEIKELQRMMVQNKCNAWELNRNWEEWADNRGYYPVTLSCVLSTLNIECPCGTEPEYVPALNHDQIVNTPDFKFLECYDNRENATKFTEIMETIATYLCTRSGWDAWPRKEYGQLVATGCTLAKNIYNCQCQGKYSQMTIYRDPFTTKMMDNMKSQLNATQENCTRQMEHESLRSIEDRESLYDRLYMVKRGAGKSTIKN